MLVSWGRRCRSVGQDGGGTDVVRMTLSHSATSNECDVEFSVVHCWVMCGLSWVGGDDGAWWRVFVGCESYVDGMRWDR
jgi:hypothetical protein